MKNILVPFDFSIHATNAFRFALNIARKSKATVHLLNVIELPMLDGPMLVPLYDYETPYHKELKEKTEKKFSKLKETFKADGINVVSKTEFGTPSTKILSIVATESIDLIVMGSHGMNGFVDFILGSTTEKIVRKSSVPVMVIKNYSTGDIKNIVFPNALETDDQEDLMKKVKELQGFFNAKLHIVFINTPINFSSDAITYAKLNAIATRFELKNFSVNIYNNLSKEEGIKQFTKMIKGDLIAIGTYGHIGLAHLMNGSLAEDVSDDADTPIWTYSLKK